MVQDDANRVGSCPADIDEVNKNSIDLGAELREIVHASLLRARVGVVPPVQHQSAQVGGVDVVTSLHCQAQAPSECRRGVYEGLPYRREEYRP